MNESPLPIRQCDLYANYQTCKQQIDEAIYRVIRSSAFIQGREVYEFEINFAAYLGAKHCIGVSSATAGLHLALEALGIGNGDRVLVPVRTVSADAEAVLMCGATPVFYDNLDEIEGTQLAKAIIIVHLYGQPYDMEKAIKFARDHELMIIEDCAQATGAEAGGRKVGTIGNIGVFSFFPSKILSCMGDGGAVVTNSDEDAKYVRMARNHGREEKHVHRIPGYNYRMDGLQAAILNAKLPHLDWFIGRRQKQARRYKKYLKGRYGIPNKAGHVYYVYPIRIPDPLVRDELSEHLRNERVEVGLHYKMPLHVQPAFQYLGHIPSDFQQAIDDFDVQLSLPIYPELSKLAVEYVCRKIHEYGGPKD